jgi:hypothetical protein
MPAYKELPYAITLFQLQAHTFTPYLFFLPWRVDCMAGQTYLLHMKKLAAI